jgi:uncharacterized protein YecE (DUF72 family)
MKRIVVGIGGWNFAPWRGTFYPKDVPAARELHYASRKLTSIEINATFYRTQSAESFRRWRDDTPDGFVFAVKATRGTTHSRELEAMRQAIERFLDSGVLELGPKLGPLLWQLPPFRKFDEKAIAAFLDLLPATQDGVALRNVVEARDKSFADPRFAALLRERNIAAALVDSEKHALLDEPTADFVYARLQRTEEDVPTGYAPKALDDWATRFRGWAETRDCFVYVISGAKVRAPAAAMAFIERLKT